MEVKLRQQEDVILKLPFSIAQLKLKMIEEMDKAQKEDYEKSKAQSRSSSSASTKKPGHVKIPTVNSLKISH